MDVAVRRISVDEYYKMAEVGILKPDERVELIDGEIVQMSPIGIRHMRCVNRFTKKLAKAVPDDIVVSVQNPIRLSENDEPQPDIVIARDVGGDEPFGPKDVILVIEVAETTDDFDRKVKVPRYAEEGIAEVWLANLPEETIETFGEPKNGAYTVACVYHAGDTIRPRLLPSVGIDAAEMVKG
jgi:Uma2 family endonuclease